MLEKLLEWIMNNYPEIFLFLAFGFICWKARGWKSKLDQKIKGQDRSIKNIRKNTIYLRRDVDSVRDDIKSIKDYLVKDVNFINMSAMKRSPLVLNDLGKQIFEIIRGDEFLETNRELLLTKLERKHPRTALDVEMSAREVCLELLSNPVFDNIKNILYNAPAINITNNDGKKEDFIISVREACFTLSIPLRDMYLKEYPELLPPEEYDEK